MSEPEDHLSDPSDIASAQEEKARMAAIATSRKAAGPVYTGYCHHCDEATPEGARWCDVSCRDAWEKLRKRGVR